jgi:hypothetical protein
MARWIEDLVIAAVNYRMVRITGNTVTSASEIGSGEAVAGCAR